jgi:hypothetical protein
VLTARRNRLLAWNSIRMQLLALLWRLFLARYCRIVVLTLSKCWHSSGTFCSLLSTDAIFSVSCYILFLFFAWSCYTVLLSITLLFSYCIFLSFCCLFHQSGSSSVLTRRAKHAVPTLESSSWGVDGETGQLVDMKDYGVWEPVVVKRQSVKTAIEVCRLEEWCWSAYWKRIFIFIFWNWIF